MKVLYIISVMKYGKGGGHAYSLSQVSESVRNLGVTTAIVSLGIRESENFKDDQFYLGHVAFNGTNYFQALRKLKRILKTYSPDVIHCFDFHCYNVVKLFIGPTKKYSFVLNKCGGPDLPNYPRAESIVVFSRENQEWFNKRSVYRRTELYLIPNRVNKVRLLKSHELEKPSGLFAFVRIVRIGPKYRASIIKSIDTIFELKKRGHNVRLYVIGVIEDYDVYSEIENYAQGKNVVFLTEDTYTANASKMLYLADAVIATGRGVMEAASLGIPIFTFASNCDYPVLLTKENFSEFFKVNFSGRLEYFGRLSLLDQIEKLVTNPSFYTQCGEFLKDTFDNYFDAEKAGTRYLEVYTHSVLGTYYVPFFYNLVNKLRTIRAFYLSSKKYR